MIPFAPLIFAVVMFAALVAIFFFVRRMIEVGQPDPDEDRLRREHRHLLGDDE